MGPDGSSTAEHTVNCFSGRGRRAGVWALEAAGESDGGRVAGCVVGVSEVDGAPTLVIAGQAAKFEVFLHPGGTQLKTMQERQDLHTAELVLTDLRLEAAASGPTHLMVRLLDQAGEALLDAVVPLQPLWHNLAVQDGHRQIPARRPPEDPVMPGRRLDHVGPTGGLHPV
jgi:hypothetical protein